MTERRSPELHLPVRFLVALAVISAVATVASGWAPTAGAAETCPRTPGRIAVALIVDDGRSVTTACVDLAPNARGSDALVARARAIGVAAPRYDSSGLLCAIDGYPVTGCGESDGTGAYVYWSYWTGSGDTWTYATAGPAGRKLADGAVEGWRFVSGRGTGAENAPRRSPNVSFANPATPTTATPATATPGPAAPPATTPVAVAGATTPPQGRPVNPATPSRPAVTSTPAGPAATTVDARSPDGSAVAPSDPAAAAPLTSGLIPEAADTAAVTTSTISPASPAELAASARSSAGGTDGGSAAPTAVGAAAVLAAGAAVVVVSRRRARRDRRRPPAS